MIAKMVHLVHPGNISWVSMTVTLVYRWLTFQGQIGHCKTCYNNTIWTKHRAAEGYLVSTLFLIKNQEIICQLHLFFTHFPQWNAYISTYGYGWYLKKMHQLGNLIGNEWFTDWSNKTWQMWNLKYPVAFKISPIVSRYFHTQMVSNLWHLIRSPKILLSWPHRPTACFFLLF